MRRKYLPIVLFIQVLLSYNALGILVEDIEYEAPVFRRLTSVRPVTLAEDYTREVISRLKSYFRWPTRSDIPLPVAEGVGEVYVSGDDISTGGVTEVEGAVPITGGVSFGGPVRAAGTVTIAGRCAPASGFSLPRGPLPYLRHPPPLPPQLPPRDFAPTPVLEPEIVDVDYLTLPTIVIPAIIVPTVTLPPVVATTPEIELGSGIGNVFVTGNDIVVTGAVDVDGAVPTIGEVTFGGYVPAHGTVTICSSF